MDREVTEDPAQSAEYYSHLNDLKVKVISSAVEFKLFVTALRPQLGFFFFLMHPQPHQNRFPNVLRDDPLLLQKQLINLVVMARSSFIMQGLGCFHNIRGDFKRQFENTQQQLLLHR